MQTLNLAVKVSMLNLRKRLLETFLLCSPPNIINQLFGFSAYFLQFVRLECTFVLIFKVINKYFWAFKGPNVL